MDIWLAVYITGLIITLIMAVGIEDRKLSPFVRGLITLSWPLFWLAVTGGMLLKKRRNRGQSGA